MMIIYRRECLVYIRVFNNNTLKVYKLLPWQQNSIMIIALPPYRSNVYIRGRTSIFKHWGIIFERTEYMNANGLDTIYDINN